MSRETEDYPGAAGDWNAQEQRREAVRRYVDRRALHLTVGEMLLALARCYAKHAPNRTDRACGYAWKSAEAFITAGMARRADAAWRWARMLHRRRCAG